MKKALGIYLMIAGILMGFYLVFNVYLPTQLPAQPAVIASEAKQSPELDLNAGDRHVAPADAFAPRDDMPIVLAKYERPVSKASTAPSSPFAVPNGLAKEVDFWTKIYSEYTTDQAVLHDPNNLGKVYGVIDLPHCDEPPTKECLASREEAIKAAKEEYARRLGLETSKKVVKVRKDVYRKGKKRGKKKVQTVTTVSTPSIRAQVGQRDKFIQGIYYSKGLLPQIEEIFNDYDIPQEITRLPFVESMFNMEARSRSGALGIWQLMPSTARILGLKVKRGVDERSDTVKATHAAAKHLKRDYGRLGSWPLALNAYNTGPGRIAGAVSQLGTKDIVKIIKNYQSSGYGFAARNFYPCFLAALRVYENRLQYFKELVPEGVASVGSVGKGANE